MANSRDKNHKLRTERGPTGAVVWTVNGHRYFWNGTGGSLKLLIGNRGVGGGEQLVSIQHPTANDSYFTEKQAKAAMLAFEAAVAEGRR